MSSRSPTQPDRPSITPAVQQRLQQVFQHATRSFEKGDFDYAHDLLSQCVSENPANLTYLQTFRANLTKQAGPGKKSGTFAAFLGKSGRGAVDKAAGKGAWQEAFVAGCGALKKNPSDIGVLQAMAFAAGELDIADCQLYYLKWALDIEPTNIETNRQAAAALSSVQEFDQAIACWQRVLQQKPNDEEASKQVSRLSVEKTIAVGGYQAEVGEPGEEGPSLANISTARVADLAAKQSDGAPRKPGRDSDSTVVETEESFEQTEARLQDRIAAASTDAEPFLELAKHYADADRLQDAERILKQAVSALPSDVTVRDRLEDLHLRRVRQQVKVAQDRRAQNDNEESRHLVKRMTDQANRAELEVYDARVKRSPGDTRLQFELGLRQKRVGDYREAIKSFQAARGDRQRLAETQILLGECFQHIEQYKLALGSYEASIEACGTTQEETKKLALYRSGVLAMGLKDYDRAEQWLTELAGLDFSYRDVADRLDKIAAIRNDA